VGKGKENITAANADVTAIFDERIFTGSDPSTVRCAGYADTYGRINGVWWMMERSFSFQKALVVTVGFKARIHLFFYLAPSRSEYHTVEFVFKRSLSLPLSLSIYIYIYIIFSLQKQIYIYIYINYFHMSRVTWIYAGHTMCFNFSFEYWT